MRITKYAVMLDENNKNVLVKEKSQNYSERKKFCMPKDIADMLNNLFHLNKMVEEYVYMLEMDTKEHAIGVFEISHGTVNASVCNPREILIRALLCGAVQFVIAHNHPSGDSTPSDEDRLVYNRIKKAGDIIGIRMLDNIIIGGDTDYSFDAY